MIFFREVAMTERNRTWNELVGDANETFERKANAGAKIMHDANVSFNQRAREANEWFYNGGKTPQKTSSYMPTGIELEIGRILGKAFKKAAKGVARVAKFLHIDKLTP
jgi:hypothetical protein